MTTDYAPNIRARSFATQRTIVALILREMVTTYGRSPGGYAWAIVEPVAAIAVLSIVFSLAFHAPALGGNFPLFYATAYLPFMLFMDVTGKLATSIRFSKSLLAYPAVTAADVLLARFLLNVLTHVLIAAIVIAGIVIVFGIHLSLDMMAIFNAFGMASVLALGVGTLNCYLFMAQPVYERLWQIGTRPLVIVSGLFFLFENVPGQYRDILWFNPLFHITGEMRKGIYGIYDATYVSPAFVYLLGATLFAFGFLILKRNYRDLINS